MSSVHQSIRSDFAVFIITFNRHNDLRETLKSVLRQTVLPRKVLVVNNGDEVRAMDKHDAAVEVTEHLMGYNAGPSAAAALALEKLTMEGFSWVQWIDDDDPPRLPDLNERLFRHLARLSDRNVGIIGAVGAYFNVATGKTTRVSDKDISGNTYLVVQTIGGNQGMLINTSVVKSKCVPTAKLFFGFEETNFCVKVLREGYEIIVPTDLFAEMRTVAGRWNLTDAKAAAPVAAWRQYYSTRNLVYMLLFEFGQPMGALLVFIRAIAKSFLLLLPSPADGLKGIAFALRAGWDGVWRNMGLTVLPQAKRK